MRDNRKALLLGAGIGAGLIGTRLLRRRFEADLSGQVALISGSSRGLGFLLAREFARNGCRVVIVINARDRAEVDRARRDLQSSGAEVFGVAADFTDPEQVREAVHQARRHFGHIDILVNNLGTIQVGPFQSRTVGRIHSGAPRTPGHLSWRTLSDRCGHLNELGHGTTIRP